jgi:PGF-pre-PGF domain-containing protein
MVYGSNSFTTLSTETPVITSGGGSGGSATIDTSTSLSDSRVWNVLGSGETEMKIYKSEIPIRNIEFTLTKQTSQAEITVRKNSDKPEDIANTNSGTVHSYLEIETKNINKAMISNVKIQFRIANTWLISNNLSKEDVALYRYSSYRWNLLPTSINSSDNSYIYYEATSPGLSHFVIMAKKAEEQLEEEIVYEEEIIEDIVTNISLVNISDISTTEIITEDKKITKLIGIIIIVIIISTGVGLYFILKKNKPK